MLKWKKDWFEVCELLARHGQTDLQHLFFSDEKLFSVEEKLNSQNTRIYAFAIDDIPEYMRTVSERE